MGAGVGGVEGVGEAEDMQGFQGVGVFGRGKYLAAAPYSSRQWSLGTVMQYLSPRRISAATMENSHSLGASGLNMWGESWLAQSRRQVR